MDGDVVEEVSVLGIVLADAAVLVPGNDVLAEDTPAGNGSLALVADNGEGPLVGLLCVDVRVDVDDDDVAEVAHALLGDAEQLGAVLVELDALDGRGELPRLELAARLDLPQADGVVCGARGDHGRGRVDVDGPDGADVAVVGAEALAVVGEPGADLLVLCDGEDEVAIEVVPGGGRVSRRGWRRDWEGYLIWVSARSCPARRMGLMMGCCGVGAARRGEERLGGGLYRGGTLATATRQRRGQRRIFWRCAFDSGDARLVGWPVWA